MKVGPGKDDMDNSVTERPLCADSVCRVGSDLCFLGRGDGGRRWREGERERGFDLPCYHKYTL